MPRHADHEQRREELADAVCEVILEGGIDKVSVRSVAQKSGWSVGAVRYYFPKQADLLEHALKRTIDGWLVRVREAETSAGDDPVARSVNMILSIAPVNDVNRRDLRIWLAFTDRGISQAHIAALMDVVWKHDRFNSRRMVASIAGLPLPSDIDEPMVDPFLEETASVLHTLWDGVCFQGILVSRRMTPDEIRRLAHRVLNTISDRIANHIQDISVAS